MLALQAKAFGESISGEAEAFALPADLGWGQSGSFGKGSRHHGSDHIL
jgi:hypothetical protein